MTASPATLFTVRAERLFGPLVAQTATGGRLDVHPNLRDHEIRPKCAPDTDFPTKLRSRWTSTWGVETGARTRTMGVGNAAVFFREPTIVNARESTEIRVGEFRALLGRDATAAADLLLDLAHAAARRAGRRHGVSDESIDDVVGEILGTVTCNDSAENPKRGMTAPVDDCTNAPPM